jgi:hypothetical protein
MCSGGGDGGGSDPVKIVADTVSDNTPDVKVEVPEVDIDVPTPQEIVEQVDDLYQDSDIDTTLEGVQEMGELMIDVVDTIISGKPEGKVEDAQNELTNTQTTLQETGENIQTGLDNLEDVVTDTVGTTNEVLTDIGTNVADQFNEAMGLTDETEGGAVTEETRGGDVERDDLMLTLGKKKSELKAQKKKGKRGLRIDYGVSLPGSGKSGIAA